MNVSRELVRKNKTQLIAAICDGIRQRQVREEKLWGQSDKKHRDNLCSLLWDDFGCHAFGRRSVSGLWKLVDVLRAAGFECGWYRQHGNQLVFETSPNGSIFEVFVGLGRSKDEQN